MDAETYGFQPTPDLVLRCIDGSLVIGLGPDGGAEVVRCPVAQCLEIGGMEGNTVSRD
jgi:hypothetical protein